jgi:hypothetical protein
LASFDIIQTSDDKVELRIPKNTDTGTENASVRSDELGGEAQYTMGSTSMIFGLILFIF